MVMIRILSDFFERFPSYETGFRTSQHLGKNIRYREKLANHGPLGETVKISGEKLYARGDLYLSHNTAARSAVSNRRKPRRPEKKCWQFSLA